MEPIIQIIIVLLYINDTSSILLEDNTLSKCKTFYKKTSILLYAPLMTMVRFEGFFMIIIVSILFLIKKKFFLSLYISVVGFLPILIYGLISIAHGWFFFPNSIILKGNLPDITSLQKIIAYILNTLASLYDSRMLLVHLFVFLLVALIILFFYWFKKKTFWNECSVLAIILIFVILFQLLFAKAGLSSFYFSRYDAYLIVLSILLISFSIKEYLPNKIQFKEFQKFFSNIKKEFNLSLIFKSLLIIALSMMVLTPLIYRSIFLISKTGQASNNIYDQQYQMGLFLKKYYNNESVIANDIGTINYFSDIKCLDLWGLMNIDVANARLNGIYDINYIAHLARENGCKIAIVYEKVLNIYGGAPASWIKVGEWTIRDNVACGDKTVSFYAVDPTEKYNLISNLRNFSHQLPSDIVQSGLYTE